MEYTIPRNLEQIGDHLAHIDDFWDHWGFEPWTLGPLAGVSRAQHFIKDGFLGRIAEYRAWDCIVWRAGDGGDREKLWNAVRPLNDVMTQRFLFLVHDPWPQRRIKSFFWGFKGYLEFYAYCPTPEGGTSAREIRDLADLVDMGLRLALTGRTGKDGG